MSILTQREMERIDLKYEELFEKDHGSLTKDEHKDLRHYHERIKYYNPFQIYIHHEVHLFDKHGIRTRTRFNPTRREERTLLRVLLDKWDSLDLTDKTIWHAINGTLPKWHHVYPATKEWLDKANEFIDKKLELIKQ